MAPRRPDPMRTPSFKGFTPASPKSSRTKQANRAFDTKAELLLRRALWRLGLRYRKNVKYLPGKPDVVFPKVRLVVFCDGDFWHGRHWRRLKGKLERRANATYWVAKIAANRARDARHQRALRRAGWHVVRAWETDVTSAPEDVAAQIKRHVDTLQLQLTGAASTETSQQSSIHSGSRAVADNRMLQKLP